MLADLAIRNPKPQHESFKVKGEFSHSFDSAALVHAAEALGFMIAKHRSGAKEIAALPTPLIAWRRDMADVQPVRAKPNRRWPARAKRPASRQS